MRRIFSLALVALALTTSLVALETDNSLGTWQANITASKYTPVPWPVKSLTVGREAVPGGVKVTTTGERTDGTPISATYSANYDGTPPVSQARERRMTPCPSRGWIPTPLRTKQRARLENITLVGAS